MVKKSLGNIGLSLCTLLLLLILGELFAGWYLSKTDDTTRELTIYQPSEVVGWEHIPNAIAEQNWDGRNITYTIDNVGLRRGFDKKETLLGKPADKKRVAVIGDSFAFGMLVNYEETFPAKLEKLIGPEVEVLNFGIIGHATDQYLLTLRDRVMKFQPDIVVVAYFVGNDATELRAHEWIKNSDQQLTAIRDAYHIVSSDHQLRRKKTSKLPRSYLFTLFTERSRILLAKIGVPVRWPNLFFSNFLPKDHPQGDPHIDEYYQKVRLLLEEIEIFTEANQTKFLVLLIPADIQVNLKYLEKYPRAPFGEKEFSGSLPQKKLLEYISTLNIEALDLLPLFRKNFEEKPEEDLYFPRKDPHFTPAGHERTAEFLLKKLKILGWL